MTRCPQPKHSFRIVSSRRPLSKINPFVSTEVAGLLHVEVPTLFGAFRLFFLHPLPVLPCASKARVRRVKVGHNLPRRFFDKSHTLVL